MKKLFLIIFMAAAQIVSAQNVQFVGKAWTEDNITSIKNYVMNFTGSGYHTVNMQTEISRSIDKAFFLFADTSGKKLSIDIQRKLTNRDPNTGIPTDTLISEVKVTGYYPPLLKMYKQYFNADVNTRQIEKSGKADPIKQKTGDQKIEITFFRSDEQSGAWTLWIKM